MAEFTVVVCKACYKRTKYYAEADAPGYCPCGSTEFVVAETGRDPEVLSIGAEFHGHGMSGLLGRRSS